MLSPSARNTATPEVSPAAKREICRGICRVATNSQVRQNRGLAGRQEVIHCVSIASFSGRLERSRAALSSDGRLPATHAGRAGWVTAREWRFSWGWKCVQGAKSAKGHCRRTATPPSFVRLSVPSAQSARRAFNEFAPIAAASSFGVLVELNGTRHTPRRRMARRCVTLREVTHVDLTAAYRPKF
jgi:hypothetical protein